VSREEESDWEEEEEDEEASLRAEADEKLSIR
jgi:hypothetical protein